MFLLKNRILLYFKFMESFSFLLGNYSGILKDCFHFHMIYFFGILSFCFCFSLFDFRGSFQRSPNPELPVYSLKQMRAFCERARLVDCLTVGQLGRQLAFPSETLKCQDWEMFCCELVSFPKEE